MAHDIPVVPPAGLQQGHPGAVPLLAYSGAGLRRAEFQDRKASRWTRAGRPVTSRSLSAPQTRHRAPARIPGRAAHRHRRCSGLCLARGDLCQPLHHRASDHRYVLERPALFWSPDRQGGRGFTGCSRCAAGVARRAASCWGFRSQATADRRGTMSERQIRVSPSWRGAQIMKPAVPKLQRCAIYTRKSTEHNLDLEFNSLDAQREACEAYIKSQSHEGWRLVPDHYDDGGLSGASLDRPALQNLLVDVRAGRINTVVVYKVDRLTRSLADFAKLVELFDQHGVSFVSITQSFSPALVRQKSSRFLLLLLVLWVCGQRVCVVRAKLHIHSSLRRLDFVHAGAPRHHRQLVVHRLMGASNIVKGHPRTDAGPRLAAVSVRFQMHLFILDRAPQAF